MNFKPKGYNSVSPYLVVPGAQKLIDLLIEVFDAEPLRNYPSPDGQIMHAEVKIDDSVIMIGDSSEKYPPVPCVIHIYLPDPDKIYKKALAAGCENVHPPKESNNDPDRRASFRDFAGNVWAVGAQVKEE